MGGKRDTGLAVGALAALILGGWFVFQSFLLEQPEPDTPVSPPLADTPSIERAMIANVQGEVTFRGADGQWKPPQPGQELSVDDSIRTGAGARASLEVGKGSNIVIAERSELAVREITEVAHEFRLDAGRISVDYEEKKGRVIKIEGAKGQTAEAKSGRFSVLATREAFTVAAESEGVKLVAAGEEVVLAAGELSVALAEAPPAKPKSVPKELLLRVAATKAPVKPNVCAIVEGHADPGSAVSVDGVAVDLATDGSFRFEARRPKGGNEVVVITRDALGRSREETVRCRKARSGIKELGIQWGAPTEKR